MPRFQKALLKSVRQVSPTVRILNLYAPGLSFKSGQWVDFVPSSLPGEIAGYSICSSFRDYEQADEFTLAVKNSPHPVSQWVHSENCVPGCDISVHVGGDFVWRCQLPSVFIAGGIGITPLYSMLRDILHSGRDEGQSRIFSALFYSSISPEEMIFRHEIQELESRHQGFKFFSHISGLGDDETRIAGSDVVQHLRHEQMEVQTADFYLCGPLNMIRSIEQQLLLEGVEKKRILYENW